MASAPNQAAGGSNSGGIPEAFGQLGPPGTKCGLCAVVIKDNGACKGQCKFGKVRKLDGVLAACICHCLTVSLVLAVMVQKGLNDREELVRAALAAAEKKGLDSAAIGFVTVIPAGIGRLDALGNATTR